MKKKLKTVSKKKLSRIKWYRIDEHWDSRDNEAIYCYSVNHPDDGYHWSPVMEKHWKEKSRFKK